MSTQIVFFLESAGAAFILWLGLFIITRDLPLRKRARFRWQRPALLAGAATVLLSIYLLGVAMQTLAVTAEEFIYWQKLTWWPTPIAILLFFYAVLFLIDTKRTLWDAPYWRLCLLPLLTLYSLLLTAGTISGFFLDNAAIRRVQSKFEAFFAPVRLPHFYLYNGFVATLLLICVVLLLWKTWSAFQSGSKAYQKFKWLGYGSLGLIAGALVGAVVHPLSSGAVPKQLGDYLLTLGAAGVSYGVARYNALAHEQLIEQDFWHSLLSVTQTILFYLVVFHGCFWVLGYVLPPLVTPLLSFLIIITQTPLGWSDTLSDRLLLPRWVIGYREHLVLMRHTLLTAEKPEKTLIQAEAAFTQVVQTARQEELATLIQTEIDQLFAYNGRLYDETILANSQLQQLTVVQQAYAEYAKVHELTTNDLGEEQRAALLRKFLFQLIEQNLANPTATAQLEYQILFKKYVEQRSRTEVENFIYETHNIVITGGAYSRKLLSARKRLALTLREAEARARQAVVG